MDIPTFTQENLLFSVITPLGENPLLFKSLEGEEHLSKLFHFDLQLLSGSRTLEFDQIVGKPMTIKVSICPPIYPLF